MTEDQYFMKNLEKTIVLKIKRLTHLVIVEILGGDELVIHQLKCCDDSMPKRPLLPTGMFGATYVSHTFVEEKSVYKHGTVSTLLEKHLNICSGARRFPIVIRRTCRGICNSIPVRYEYVR